ncbi:MAG: twin-arginine translocation signal domain-containing protein, partial [Deltaproteobacteria bacterium]|nr:twin-arginine translocation signal domain-containing protein [Deltaproteobacteria bacterium]
MKRRDFVKTTAAGSALLLTPVTWILDNDSRKFCYQSERKIPVAYEVDIVVIGGSLAGVAAA